MGKSKIKPPDCGGSIAPPPSGSGTTPPAAGDAAAGKTPAGGDAVTAKCPKSTRSVNTRVTETITNGNPASWNGTYAWDSKYELTVEDCKAKVVVRIKVTGTITEAQKTGWKNAIQSKWNNKVYFCCSGCECPKGLPCTVSVEYVDAGEHYEVTAQTPGAAEGGRSGLGGTTSMTGWGVNDTVDVTHEFGHMLGNPEEYFTTNGVDYSEGGTKQPFRDPGGGIMNNPANNPLPRNYDPIRSQVETSLGSSASCSTRAVGA
jgi:hypothetical protein